MRYNLLKSIVLLLVILVSGTKIVLAQSDKNPAKAPQPATAKATTTNPAPAPMPVPDEEKGIFKFVDSGDTHNFGEVPEGPLAQWDFVFYNVGKKPFVISEAHGSCGCTVPTVPKDTIYPAKRRFFGLLKGKPKKYKIHVTYNTNGRQGNISKEVIITSTAKQNPMTLHIRGFVTPAVKEKEVKTPPTQQLTHPAETK